MTTRLVCARFLRGLDREREVHRLLGETRARLAVVYASAAPCNGLRIAKTAEIDRLRERYRELRAALARSRRISTAGSTGPINNATLGAVAAYDQLVGTLRVILDSEGGDLPAFYRASRLGRLSADDRAAVLREITTPDDLRTWRAVSRRVRVRTLDKSSRQVCFEGPGHDPQSGHAVLGAHAVDGQGQEVVGGKRLARHEVHDARLQARHPERQPPDDAAQAELRCLSARRSRAASGISGPQS